MYIWIFILAFSELDIHNRLILIFVIEATIYLCSASHPVGRGAKENNRFILNI